MIGHNDNFCYCGGDIAEESVKREDVLCNVMCSDVSNRTCGGDWLMSVYDTHSNVPGSDHNGSVSFLIGLSTGIRVYNSTSLPEFDTVMVTNNAWAYTVDYHYARKLVFTNTKGKLMMVGVSSSFGPENTTPSLVKELSQCDGFAVDWVADKIYWVDCTSRRPPSIMRLNLDGSDNEMVMSLGGNPRGIKRMEIDPYYRMLFWLADGVIETLNLTSKVFHTNVSGPGIVVRALALDRSAQKVYFVGAIDQIIPLFSMDYSGSSQLRIFYITQMQSVFGLGIHGGFIYWVNYAMSTDIIYKAPLHLQGSREVKMIQTVDKAVWHMRVVHPDIQKTPVANPCAQKGCSQFCMAVTSTTAVCQCSMGYELGNDGLSCESGPASIIFSTRTTSTTTPVPRTSMVPRTTQYGNTTYIGCFSTAYAYQQSNNHKMHFITLDKCISHCVVGKSRFAGIAARDMNCFCGNDLATKSTKNNDMFCNDICPGLSNSGLSCGGDWLMSLYDISKMLPNDEQLSDEDSVNFLMGHSDSVRIYNSTNMNSYRRVMDTPNNEWAYSVDFHYNENLMFMSTRRKLYKTRLFSGNQSSTVPSEVVVMGRCEGFAVDWVFDRIFWANCSDSEITTISVVDLNGRNPAPVRQGLGDGMIKRMEVDPYSGILFWTRDEVIESCDTSGQNFRTNLSSQELSVRGIALDIHDKRLFYMGNRQSDADLFSVDYEGGDLKTYFHIRDMRSVYGLGIVRGYVYWVNYRAVDMLYKAPLDSRGVTQQKLLKVFGSDNTVWHMKVVDRDLQSPPITGPCSDGDVSCRAQKGQKAKKDITGVVLIVVFLVVGGIVLAGLLVILTNMRYWEIVRAKLTKVPYSRENGRDTDGSTRYDTNEDSVNLI